MVDVSNEAERKWKVVRAHKSQFYDPNSTEPETRLSSPAFLEMVETRMRYWGGLGGRFPCGTVPDDRPICASGHHGGHGHFEGKRVKIGITCYPTYGGSGVIATELGKELAKLGHEIHFVSYAVPIRLDKFSERIFFHEVEMLPYPLFQYPPYDLALAAKMMEIAENSRLDLYHVHYALPHAVSAYLAKLMMKNEKLKIVTTLHGTDITLVGMDKTYFPITKFGIQKSDGVTTVSRYLQQLTQERVGREDIDVIPNFVDTNFFQIPENHDCAKQSITPHGEPVLLHISNFRPVKRIGDVLKIFEKTLAKLPVRLVLVGVWSGTVFCGTILQRPQTHEECVVSWETGQCAIHHGLRQCTPASERIGKLWIGGAGSDEAVRFPSSLQCGRVT